MNTKQTYGYIIRYSVQGEEPKEVEIISNSRREAQYIRDILKSYDLEIGLGTGALDAEFIQTVSMHRA